MKFHKDILKLKTISSNSMIKANCLKAMPLILDKTINLIVCDLPYGVTNNNDDVVIPFDKLWEQYKRIITDDGIILLFGQGLFYIDLVSSNRDWFKYDIVWDKQLSTGFLNAKKQPLRVHEQIAVFYKKKGTYNPQFTIGKPIHSKGKKFLTKDPTNNNYNSLKQSDDSRAGETKKYPKSIISFQKPHLSKAVHRTEKSIPLLEWLIKTYSNEGDLVLDNTAGSFSCGVACLNTKRDFIGIEMNKDYYNIGVKRIKDINKLF